MTKSNAIARVGSLCSLFLLLNCDNASVSTKVSNCQEKQDCTYICDSNNNCAFQCAPNPNVKGCDSATCNSCDPNAKIQSASVSLQGGQTCPVTTTHYNTYKTPGCWCYVPFVGDRCCYCGGGLCYTTDSWTTTEYVPAPLYGSCP